MAAERTVSWVRARGPGAAAVGAGGLAFAVYAATAVRGVSFADWAEAQVVPAVLGIMHPTGYPTYTLLGWLVDLIPVGSVALRANLLSGACTAAALAALTLILARLGVRPLLAAAVSLALGFTADLWINSTHAEVHTLHLLFVALLLHRLLVWGQAGRPRDLWLGALLLGLSFGNHMLTLTLAPALVLGALWLGRRAIRRRPAIVGGAIVAGLLGLSVYLYLPLRSLQRPAVMYADLGNLAALMAHVTGTQFETRATFLTAEGPVHFYEQLQVWLAPPGGYLLALVLAAAAVGCVRLARRAPGYALVVLAVVLITAYVANNSDVGRTDQYQLAAAVGIVVFLGLAAEGAVASLEAAFRDEFARALARGLATGLVLLVPLVLLLNGWAAADQSHNDDGQQFVDAVLAELPPDAVLFDLWDTRTPLEYAQQVEGRRRDVTITENATTALADAAAGRPVYVLQVFDVYVDEIRAHYPLTQVAVIALPYGTIDAPYRRPLYRVDVPPPP